jgi:2-polyprenyl-3-methyl-5-hydroxy-6-metoxy-1,4-benzoquinol methylase
VRPLRNRDEQDAATTHGLRYGRPVTEATRRLERLVIGSDFGASGYTTIAQANQLAGLLGLERGKRLLDIGCGRGWPGLYLASATGCTAVLADIPDEGLRVAQRRACDEGFADRVSIVTASARHLPFNAESFDAIVHTDVLC